MTIEILLKGIHPKTLEKTVFEVKGARPSNIKGILENVYGTINSLSERLSYEEIKDACNKENYTLKEYVRYK
jgi:hypothetical protein